MCTVVNVIFQKEREEKREGRVTYIKKKTSRTKFEIEIGPILLLRNLGRPCSSGAGSVKFWADFGAVSNFGHILGHILGRILGTCRFGPDFGVSEIVNDAKRDQNLSDGPVSA